MKRTFLVLYGLLILFLLNGQATFILNSIPSYTHNEDVIYIAGSLNSWNPGDPDFALQKNEHNNWFIVLPEEPDGTLVEFKFTRGDWGTVEKGATGEEIANRQFVYGNGDTIYVDILNWSDNGGGGGSTAAGNVTIMDDNYRTLPDREFTGIMGSSLGGLISHYGVLKHQDIFSKAGIFSPSYWFSDTVWTFTTEMGKQNNMKLYQLIGGQEGVEAVADMWAMHDVLANMGFNEDELFSLEVPDGEHNEAFWRNQFAAAYLWMFESFANKIDVRKLAPGSYILRIRSQEKLFQGKFIKQ